ncbi:MAG: chlorite dismutase family protein [Chloroflexota bacterium]
MRDQVLCSFSFIRLLPTFWQLDAGKRKQFFDRFYGELKRHEEIHVESYQIFPLKTQADFLVWASIALTDRVGADRFFEELARFFTPFRSMIEVTADWWGMTRPSDYSRGKSAQEIDPFSSSRARYLIFYPFTKTAEWYKLSRDTRQGMMNEHIRIGHSYPEIKQLLLYSIGLQDQEFIVTYETEDLNTFSLLVTELRSSEARRFTLSDTPLFTAVYRKAEEIAEIFSGEA